MPNVINIIVAVAVVKGQIKLSLCMFFSSTTRLDCTLRGIGRPVACQVIHEPGIGQFCEFEPRRVHTRFNSM